MPKLVNNSYVAKSNTLPLPEFAFRMNSMKTRIREIAHNMGYLAKDRLNASFQTDKTTDHYSWHDCSMAASGGKNGGEVFIPKLFLLNISDLPSNLKINNVNDPRLQSDDYIICVAKEAQKLLGINDITIDKSLIKNIRSHLLIALNPDLKKKSLDFVFGHEVAHLYSDDSNRKRGYDSKCTWTARQWLTSLLIAAAICISVGAVFFATPLGITSFVVGGIIGECAGGVYLLRALKYNDKKFSRECEIEADLRSARTLKENIGGIHFFKVLQKINGNHDAAWSTHPSYDERIVALENYQKKPRSNFIPLDALRA